MIITKKMADKKRFRLPFYYFPRGRDAFEHILRGKEARGRTVLLPGYIGYGAAEGSGARWGRHRWWVAVARGSGAGPAGVSAPRSPRFISAGCGR